MNDDARLERIFADALSQSAPSRAPDRLRADITTSVSRTRPRPRWLALLKEPPMQYSSSVAVGSPMARLSSTPARQAAWIILLVVLTITLAAATVIVGSRLLRDAGPDRSNSGILVPTVALDQTWDASTIEGLSLPSGMDIGPDGNLYVVNAGAGEIIVLDPDGHVVRRWGGPGSGPGQFIFHGDTQDPLHAFGGIAVTPDGSVYVMDTANDRVQQFDMKGTFVRQWGGYGTGPDQFILDFDLSDGPDGTVYVKDVGRGDIRRFGPDGTYEQTIATAGSATGQFADDSGGIFVDAEGALYTADGTGNRVLAWNTDGTYRGAIGHDGPAGSTLVYPYDVSVDGSGNVYATEPARMLVFTPDGTLASTWQIPDAADPNDGINPIAIAADGTVYVSAWHRDVIYKLRTTQREMVEQASAAPSSSVAPSAVVPSTAAATLSPMAGSSLTRDGLAVTDTFALPFTADQPPDWQVHWLKTGGAELSKPVPGSTMYIKAAVRVFVPTNAYADACHSADGPISPPIGPGVDDLVTALTSIPGVRVSVPVHDVAIDGFAGKAFDLESMLLDSDCPDDGAWFPMWTFDDGGTQTFAGPGSGFHQHIVVLDVNGTRVLIESWTFTDTSITDLVDTQHVFDSIDFQ